MVCPECKTQYQEGTTCPNCEVDLLTDLGEPVVAATGKSSGCSKLLNFRVEHWLTIGALALIFFSIVFDGYQFFSQIARSPLQFGQGGNGFVMIFNFCYTIIRDFMFGLLYFGLGQIVAWLKRGVTQ